MTFAIVLFVSLMALAVFAIMEDNKACIENTKVNVK